MCFYVIIKIEWITITVASWIVLGSRYDEVGNVGKLLSKDSSNYIYEKHLCLKDLYNNFTHNGEKVSTYTFVRYDILHSLIFDVV